LRNGLVRHGIKQFYIEAVVGLENKVSQRVATKVISETPKETTDFVSGLPALVYTRLIEAAS